MMYRNSKQNFLTGIIAITLSVFYTGYVSANAEEQETVTAPYYEAVNGEVDAQTFMGYNAYHNACVRCHGVGGSGTDIAPNLVESVSRLSPAKFRLKVLHAYAMKFTPNDWTQMENAMLEQIRKQQQRDSGELETMPKWKNNPMIKENVGNIYRYLKARADEVIGADKPGLIRE